MADTHRDDPTGKQRHRGIGGWLRHRWVRLRIASIHYANLWFYVVAAILALAIVLRPRAAVYPYNLNNVAVAPFDRAHDVHADLLECGQWFADLATPGADVDPTALMGRADAWTTVAPDDAASSELAALESVYRSSLTMVLVAAADDMDRAQLLFASLKRFITHPKVQGFTELVVICPDANAYAFEAVLSTFATRASTSSPDVVLPGDTKLRYRIIKDGQLLSNSFGLPGFASQMLLKLLVARYVRTEFYVTLEADVILAGRLTASDILRSPSSDTADGSDSGIGQAVGAGSSWPRALMEPERRSSHAASWTASESMFRMSACPSTASASRQRKTKGAADDADDQQLRTKQPTYSYPRSLSAEYMSVTPAVLSRTVAAAAVCRLKQIHGAGSGDASAWLKHLYRYYWDVDHSYSGVQQLVRPWKRWAARLFGFGSRPSRSKSHAAADVDVEVEDGEDNDVDQGAWTEYTLYYLAGQCFESRPATDDKAFQPLFDRYHRSPEPGERRLLGLASVLSHQSNPTDSDALVGGPSVSSVSPCCVWVKEDWTQWVRNGIGARAAFAQDRPNHFLVIHSTAGVAAGDVKRQVMPYLDPEGY